MAVAVSGRGGEFLLAIYNVFSLATAEKSRRSKKKVIYTEIALLFLARSGPAV